jgi:Flavin containing amine oxidoreductase
MFFYAWGFHIRVAPLFAILIPSTLALPKPAPALATVTLERRWDTTTNSESVSGEHNNKQVLILGGGVAGVLAARKLTQEGITDFLIVEARDELGGRMRSTAFGNRGGAPVTVELGANWIQGTQSGDGPANPILVLAKKHNISTIESDYFGSMSASFGRFRMCFDDGFSFVN